MTREEMELVVRIAELGIDLGRVKSENIQLKERVEFLEALVKERLPIRPEQCSYHIYSTSPPFRCVNCGKNI